MLCLKEARGVRYYAPLGVIKFGTLRASRHPNDIPVHSTMHLEAMVLGY